MSYVLLSLYLNSSIQSLIVLLQILPLYLFQNDRECVNSLSAQHWEERQLVKMKWESDISHARDTQKREFRDWVNIQIS